jgi:hypothetical protein
MSEKGELRLSRAPVITGHLIASWGSARCSTEVFRVLCSVLVKYWTATMHIFNTFRAGITQARFI